MRSRAAGWRVEACFTALLWAGIATARPADLPRLQVSENGRFLVTEDGRPFFWMADTAWALHQNLGREDVLRYLDDARSKGFNAVQLMTVNAWALQPHTMKDYYGDAPYIDGRPWQLNPPYWSHLAWVIDEAARRGIYVFLVYGSPGRKDERVPYVRTPAEAYAYGHAAGAWFAGKRNLVWGNGIDVNPDDTRRVSEMGFEGWGAMAEGVTDGVSGDDGFDGKADYTATLMSYHPRGGCTSSTWFWDAPWLDFSGAQVGLPTGVLLATLSGDYRRTPVKPIINLEPWYERCDWKKPPVNDWEVRRQAYQSVFAGAFGHTYGNFAVYPFDSPEEGKGLWRESLTDPGRCQMQHLRRLMESRPFLTRVPDQSLIARESLQGGKLTHLIYTRAADGHAALYLNGRRAVEQQVAGTLENWDASLRLALANELTQDRPWRGTYRMVAIYGRALSPQEAEQHSRAGAGARPEGTLVLYTFEEGAGDTVRDVSGAGDALDLKIADPQAVTWTKGGGLAVRSPVLIASAGPAGKVTAAITKSGAITVEAWVTPADNAQTGPARIVTLSRDPGSRNFTLGQQADACEVRLRTTATSENGLPGLATTDQGPRHVQATRDESGSYAMLYVPTAGQTVTVDTSKLSGKRFKAWWYDPRTGRATALKGDFPVGGRLEFTSPPEGPDWVLVLDDAAKEYPRPGTP